MHESYLSPLLTYVWLLLKVLQCFIEGALQNHQILPNSNNNDDGTKVQELYNFVTKDLIAASLMCLFMDACNYFDPIVNCVQYQKD
jgi:hypothetical protein